MPTVTDVEPLPRYRYLFYDAVTNTFINSLPLSNVEYENGIYKAFQASGDIAVTEETLNMGVKNATTPGKRTMYIMRNDECVWGGIVWTRDYQPNNRTLKITALTFEAYLYSRFWRRTKVYSATSQYAIARQILGYVFDDFASYGTGAGFSDWTGVVSPDTEHYTAPSGPVSTLVPNRYVWPLSTAANLGITIPAAPVGVNEADSIYNREESNGFMGYNFQTVGESLYKFAVQEYDAGTAPNTTPMVSFEYRINCRWDETVKTFRREMLFGYRVFGRAKNVSTDYVVFDYPGSVADYTYQETVEGAATRAWYSGAGEGVEKMLQPVYDKNRIEDQGWPLLEAIESDGKVYDPRTLTFRAKRLLADKRAPIPTFSITVLGNEYPQFKLPVGNPARWDLGDWIRIRIDDPWFYLPNGTKQIRVYDARVIRYKVKVTGDPDRAREVITMEFDDFHQYSATSY